MTPGTRTLAPLLLAFAISAGCDLRPEDLSSTRADVQAFHDAWARRAAEASARHAALMQRAQAVPADAPGAADLMSVLTGVRAELDALPNQLAAVRDEALAKLDERKRKLAEEALGRGGTTLRSTIDGIFARLDDAARRLDAIEQEQRAAAAAPPPPPPPAAATPIDARAQGTTPLPGITFAPGTAQLDVTASQPALDQLVAFAQTCDRLRFSLAVPAARPADARLATQQAQSVRAYLLTAGVAADKIAIERGAPRPGEAPAVTVKVLAPCPAT